VKTTTASDDEVQDLPGGVFFSGEILVEPPETLPGLFYKDATDTVRRVWLARSGRFEFAPFPASAHFRSVGELLFVPELDPRAWAAARSAATRPLPELSTLRPGSFFTALSANENEASHRRGVYRLGNDGMFRRLLKEAPRGLKWSDAIPSDRFAYFGQRLAVTQE
jgi:hypothetical protein